MAPLKLKVIPATKDDLPRWFEIMSAAFGSGEDFLNAYWPGHTTAEGRAIAVQRTLEMWDSVPHWRWMKAVTDDEDGKMVGITRWIVWTGQHEEPPTVPWHDSYETEENRAYAEHVMTEFVRRRYEALRKCDYHMTSLDLVAVDPEYHRKGVGHALIKEGVAKVDELGHVAVVEASPNGQGLYMQYGWEVVEPKFTTPVPSRFDNGERQGQSASWLIRPAKGTTLSRELRTTSTKPEP